eukprot:IDg3921t1
MSGPSKFSAFTVEVEHFRSNVLAVFHVCRIKTYAYASWGSLVQMKDVADLSDRIWHSVEKIKDH